jgi:hypothetical protein
VDDLGRYKGGLPVRGKGKNRAGALGEPGELHSVGLHRQEASPIETEMRVTPSTSQHFRVWSEDEREAREWRFQYQIASVDYNFFKFEHYRRFWRYTRNLFLLFVAIPFFAGAYTRTVQRSIKSEIDALIAANQPFEGKVYDGLKVVVGPTGTLKLQDPREKTH